MQPKAPLAAFAGTLLLALGAGAILVAESRHEAAQAERAREYQELVGGLGFGPATDLSRCPASFDPRLCRRCPEDLGPITGGGCFCPHHACSVLPYPPLDCRH